MRISEIVPDLLKAELLRLAQLDRYWLQVDYLGNNEYRAINKHPSWIRQLWQYDGDAFGMYALSLWLHDGPKIFTPTRAHCDALEQIEVRLPVENFTSPFPVILVRVNVPPFHSVIIHRWENAQMVTASLLSEGNKNDIVTSITTIHNELVENSLVRFDEDCRETSSAAHRVLRIGCNAVLALSNYGNILGLLYPKEVERDRRLVRMGGEKAAKARERISGAIQVVSFNQEITLHRTERSAIAQGIEPGGSVKSHWRRGHWAMQVHGPANSLRKRILRPPVLVRADLFAGELSDTSVSIKG